MTCQPRVLIQKSDDLDGRNDICGTHDSSGRANFPRVFYDYRCKEMQWHVSQEY
jgi:hypothetical protein